MKKIICLPAIVFLIICVNYCFAQPPATKQIVFYTWKEYIDKSILEDFEKQFDIKVILKEYETRDMMLSEVQSESEQFDVILATDITVPLLIKYRLLAELDLTKIPNRKFIKKQFQNLPLDPDNKYSLAGYLWAFTGLAVNTDFVKENIDSWSALWDKKYKGKIALMDDCHEAMAAVLKYSNFSINTTDHNELAIAEKNAVSLKENEVQFNNTFENIEKVMDGRLWIAQTYNGDFVYKAENITNIRFILPREGVSLTVDNFVISVDSRNKNEAHQFINFLMSPANAARSSTTFFYPTVIEADYLIGKELLKNPVAYPPVKIFRIGNFPEDIGSTESEYVRIFNLLKQKQDNRVSNE
ncbi:MAG: ABC transporter substrate-binding protein [Sedimentisphaerales bacterium]